MNPFSFIVGGAWGFLMMLLFGSTPLGWTLLVIGAVLIGVLGAV